MSDTLNYGDNPAAAALGDGTKAMKVVLVDDTTATIKPTLVATGTTPAISATPAVTVGAYASGQCIGGKQTLNGLARVPGGTGVVISAAIFSKVANTSPIDILLFHADPTASTLTDKSTFNLAAADFDKISGVIHVTDWTALGTPVCIGQNLGVGLAYKIPAGATVGYAVLVARGSITFASTSDIKLVIKPAQD